jgi:RND family efflux transporter MFP subunit
VTTAKARVMTAQANLVEIRQQATRERRLAGQGLSPTATAEDLEARAQALTQQVVAAEAEVKAAQAEVKSLEINLGYTKIVAPIDGTVVGKPIQAGELVGGMQGISLAELVDFTSLLVEADVPEGRLHLLQPGTPTEIVLDAFPGKRYRGKVAEVSPRVNRSKATVTVKVAFVDDRAGVLPDMAARVSFLSEALDAGSLAEPPKQVVPAAAITERGGAKVVFVVNEGAVRMTPVELGPAFGSGFELVRGPAPGTRLVKDPPSTLADGQRIKEQTEDS